MVKLQRKQHKQILLAASIESSWTGHWTAPSVDAIAHSSSLVSHVGVPWPTWQEEDPHPSSSTKGAEDMSEASPWTWTWAAGERTGSSSGFACPLPSLMGSLKPSCEPLLADGCCCGVATAAEQSKAKCNCNVLASLSFFGGVGRVSRRYSESGHRMIKTSILNHKSSLCLFSE